MKQTIEIYQVQNVENGEISLLKKKKVRVKSTISLLYKLRTLYKMNEMNVIPHYSFFFFKIKRKANTINNDENVIPRAKCT